MKSKKKLTPMNWFPIGKTTKTTFFLDLEKKRGEKQGKKKSRGRK